MTVDSSTVDVDASNQASPQCGAIPRVWPAMAVLLIQFVALVLTITPAINNAIRFGFMMLGPAMCVLLFIGWLVLAFGLAVVSRCCDSHRLPCWPAAENMHRTV